MRLPQITKLFLRTPEGRRRERFIRQFHRWMKRWNLTFSKLSRANIEGFIHYPGESKVKPSTSVGYRYALIPYLQCLRNAGYLKFDPQCLRKRPPIYPLPRQAKSFLRHLETILKKSTCNGYKGSLRNFYQWLDANHLSLKDINRQHMTRWIQHLNDNKRSASSRAARIVHIRIYFYWLNEQGILKTAFNRLIRSSDIPKLPDYLPRPLPPDTDRELQVRLERSHCRYQQGLLLMRKTGIRVGELISLEQNCVRIDSKGNAFLKVPLGKLDNERLVPLEHTALQIVEKLQKHNTRRRKKIFLIERGNPKRKTYYTLYAKAIQKATEGLETDGRITTHRLRHTYATTLLNGGMSLIGLMKLMGHRSYRMTLRYAAVTQETIGKEYFEALDRIQNKYSYPLFQNFSAADIDPVKMLSDVIRWIQNRTAISKTKSQTAKSLIKRIQRIQSALKELDC